jgi:NADPH-dependent 2,4-dienoyl-CoA reductase/sulfur reductase-like enzyme
MRDYKYLIIGGGMTADAAVKGIREVDPVSKIGIISSDSDPPYDRPPLTKALWKGSPMDSVWRHTQTRNVDLHLGRIATAIDVQRKRVTDDSKDTYLFDKLLLATGGTPRRLPFGDKDIIYYRTLQDYRRLRHLTDTGQRFAVIGGGFIGSELAASLTMNNKQVVMIFPGTGICDRMFPSDLVNFLNDFYKQKGVELWTGDSAVGLERKGEQLLLKTQNRREILVDGVIAGIGILPNLDLAKMAGLQTADGIVVDDLLRTSRPDIFAAGDVALFYNPALDRRIRVEHEDNANTMGRFAGRNMAGAAEPYDHLPFFYSDLFELGYEAVGELDSRLQSVIDWREPYREGVIFYQRDGLVRGVLLWNIFGQVHWARDIIASKRPFTADQLRSELLKTA